MSIRLTVASALEDFPFDPAVGFLGQKPGEQPCYYCVISLQRDVRICCVVKEGSATRCIICADMNQKCCAIPQELLGAAQKIWNAYTAHVLLDDWSGLERWRIANCFEECTSAFKKTYEVILKPHRNMSTEVILLQEIVALRGHMRAIMCLLAGEVLTPAEANARWAVDGPTYTVNCPEVHTLRNCLQRIDNCPDTAITGEKSNRREFGKKLKPELVALLDNASADDAPAPRIFERMP